MSAKAKLIARQRATVQSVPSGKRNIMGKKNAGGGKLRPAIKKPKHKGIVGAMVANRTTAAPKFTAKAYSK